MAVRKPLYNVSGDLREMDTTMVDAIVARAVYQYSLNPSVALSVVGSGGNIGSITDTRKQAGAQSTSTTAFPSEATTAEPSTVTVTYDKISSANASVTPTSDTGKTWPVYYNASGQIQAMSLTDVKDTSVQYPLGTGLFGPKNSRSHGGSTLVGSRYKFDDSFAVGAEYLFTSHGSIPTTFWTKSKLDIYSSYGKT